MDVSKYRALFIEEGREHVAEMSRLLVELETSSERGPLIDEVFRHAHSIKSMAATMEYTAIASLAHRLEDVVGLHRSSGAPFAAATVDTLLRSVDALAAQVESVATDKPVTPQDALIDDLERIAHPEVLSTDKPKPVDELPSVPAVRVRLVMQCSAPALRAFLIARRLGELGEIARTQPPLDEIKGGQMRERDLRIWFRAAYDRPAVEAALERVPDIETVIFEAAADAAPTAVVPTVAPPPTIAASGTINVHSETELSHDAVRSLATVRVRTNLLDDIMDSIGELFIVRERLRLLLLEDARPGVRGAVDGLGRRIRQLHDQVIAARMMPMRSLTDRYPRLVRDLCRTLQKDIELDIQGRDIEIDRAILDNLDVPFIHTLRNAVDHGIEAPADRVTAGKPAQGRISISAARDRDSVLVTIEDDGRGLDADKLRQVAIERGLVSADEAREMSQQDALYLICLPGFSTKAEVSDISGRGVGMDVVVARLESLGGTLEIESNAGRGTRFIFRLPQTLAIIPVLLVSASSRVFAVPVAKVVAVRETSDNTLTQPDGRRYVAFQHGLLRIHALSHLLALDARATPNHVVVVESGRELHALGVDGVVGYHEVVVKSLGDPLDRLELFAGATILGDGQPILILDLPKTLRTRSAA